MRKFGINTLSNLISRLWSLISVYIFIPSYIQILGETSYGLVSFFATLQTALNLLGLGLSNTLRREFAVGDNTDDVLDKKYKLLRSIELIYIFICIAIIIICTMGAGYISSKWLNIEDLNPVMVTRVINLMGISIALQLLSNLYVGCLFGLDHQVMANIYTVIWSILKCVGSLLLIKYVINSLVVFYTWHVFVDILYLIALRVSLSIKIHVKKRAKWIFKDMKNISSVWGYTMGILLISFISLINRQLDKLVISNNLSITELGAYNVATTLGSLTSIVPSSVAAAVFPSFTLQATSKADTLKNQFVRINNYISIIIACMSSYIAVFSLPLIRLWTGSELYVGVLGIVSFFVVLAVAIIEYQEIPYVLALAYGNTRINVIVGSVFIPFVGVSTFLAIDKWGLLGAGIVYLIMMLLQTIVYLYMIFKKYTDISPVKLILKQFVFPMITSLACAVIAYHILSIFKFQNIVICILAVLFGLVTLLLEIVFFGGKEMIGDLKKIIIKKEGI